jgi:carbon-monoxide dehydrogenase medium subunit
VFAEAGRIAAAECRPTADQRGPVEYKRHLAGELVARALERAAARAPGT